jgi:hypothetical protein
MVRNIPAQGEPVTLQARVAGALMAPGVELILTETHGHEDEAIEHEHRHMTRRASPTCTQLG